MELRALRDRATEAFTKGRFSRAAELYAEYCAKDPKDLQARLRMGDAWVKAGERDRAVSAYRSAAEGFAREGFLPRAIAAAKLVLEQDASHQGIQQFLAELYARRDRTARPAPAPAAAAPTAFDELSLEDAGSSTGAPTLTLLQAVEAAAGFSEPEASGDPEEEVFSLELSPAPVRPDHLPKIPLFSDLPPDAFIELLERCPLRRFSSGERIIEQGSVGDAFYVVCEGSVRVLREDDGGQERPLATLEAGAFFGEMALLSDAPRSASVDSLSDDTGVLEIAAPVLAELSARHPPIATALKRFCRQRMLQNLVRTSPLFGPFSKEERRQLLQRFRPREVNAGEVLVHEGRDADGLYVILSGEAEVRREEKLLAKLSGGEVFGEISLLRKAAATATVRATRRTSLIRLPRADFDELILSHPQILVLVAELTEDRLRHTDAVLAGVLEAGEEGLLLV